MEVQRSMADTGKGRSWSLNVGRVLSKKGQGERVYKNKLESHWWTWKTSLCRVRVERPYYQ